MEGLTEEVFRERKDRRTSKITIQYSTNKYNTINAVIAVGTKYYINTGKKDILSGTEGTC